MPDAAETTDRNQIGQIMGRKGRDTRARLVTAAAEAVQARPLRELRVADIARRAGVSAPNFYVYFPDVGAAVLAALEDHPQATPEILDLLSRPWDGPDGAAHILAFVRAYLATWQDNFALLRARNLAADEGDARFLAQRMEDIGPILTGLADKFSRSQARGLVSTDISPVAAAGVVLAGLERIAAAPRWGLVASAPDTADFETACAHLLRAALGL